MSDQPTDPVTPDPAPPVDAAPIAQPTQPDAQPAQQTTQPEPSEPSWSFRQAAQQAGYRVDNFENDEAAARAFFNYTRDLQGRASKPEPPPEPKPAAEEEWTPDRHFDSLWSVPKYNADWASQLVRNPQTGQMEPHPDLPWSKAQQVAEQYMEWKHSHETAIQGLLGENNPYKKMYEAMLPALERHFAKREDIGHSLQDRDDDAFLDQFVDQHMDWLKTDDGKKFMGLASDLVWGTQDPKGPTSQPLMGTREALQRAARYVQPQAAQPAAAPAQPPSEPQNPTEKPEKPTEPKSFLEDAARKAGHRPTGGAPPEGNGQRGLENPEEVRTILTRKYRAQQAQAT